MYFSPLFKSKANGSKPAQVPAKPSQIPAKKKALISLDWLRRFEPFQWLIVTPGQKIFLPPFLRPGLPQSRALPCHLVNIPSVSDFRKKMPLFREPGALKAIPSRRVML
jgi:hypothetical protein